MIDKQKLTEIYKTVVDWLCVAFSWLKSTLDTLLKREQKPGEKIQGREIPYSQFLSLVNDNKVDKAVVTQHFINGSLKEEDKKNRQGVFHHSVVGRSVDQKPAGS